MAVDIEQIHAALPEVIGDESDLDAILRRVCRVPDWDGAKVSALRTVAFHNRLVVQAPGGQLVKGELPTTKSFLEAENERIAEIAAEERRQREAMFPPEKYINPLRVQTEQFITEIVGTWHALLEDQVNALEAEVRELRQQLDVLITHEIAA